MSARELKEDLATIMDAWTASVGTLVLTVKIFLADTFALSGLSAFTDGTMGILSWFIAFFTMIWAFFRAVESVYSNYVKFREWLNKR